MCKREKKLSAGAHCPDSPVGTTDTK